MPRWKKSSPSITFAQQRENNDYFTRKNRKNKNYINPNVSGDKSPRKENNNGKK